MTTTIVLFISLALACSVGLALIVIMPWLRGQGASDNQLMAVNVATFQARLEELATDKAAGRLNGAEYETQVVELQRQLLSAQVEAAPYRPASRASRLIVLVWIPLLTVLVYLLGDDRTAVLTLWQGQDKLGQVADDLLTGVIDTPPEWATTDSAALISAMQTNVHRHAHDPNRWMRLSELFISLEATKQALEALARAHRLAPHDEQIAATYAQLSFFANEGQLTADSRKIVADILAGNPEHEGAMMLLAMGETRAGNYSAAKQWVARLRSSIAKKPGDHSVALASLDTMAETIDTQAAQAADNVTVTVSVAPSILVNVAPSDTLFVAITDGEGQAPYAVARLPTSSIVNGQVQVPLGDANAMLPERTLSKARAADAKLLVTARLSKSGDAISQAGDLAASPVLLNNATDVKLIIDTVVP